MGFSRFKISSLYFVIIEIYIKFVGFHLGEGFVIPNFFFVMFIFVWNFLLQVSFASSKLNLPLVSGLKDLKSIYIFNMWGVWNSFLWILYVVWNISQLFFKYMSVICSNYIYLFNIFNILLFVWPWGHLLVTNDTWWCSNSYGDEVNTCVWRRIKCWILRFLNYSWSLIDQLIAIRWTLKLGL
jgi:hypothetical protein